MLLTVSVQRKVYNIQIRFIVMNKGVVLVVIVLAGVFILFSLALLYNFDFNKDNFSLSEKTNQDNQAVKDNSQDNQGTTTQNSSSEGGSDGGNVGAGGGSGGSGVSGGGEVSSEGNNTISRENSCMLVRPGNLPNIKCSVNYIKQDSVSLKIKNEIGDKIDIELKIDTCNPELRETIENMDEKDFVFFCINQNYFNQALYLSYIFGNESRVEIGGFVSGSVV